jgi:hypothetical protein
VKFLFCLECQGIVRLSPERRACRCGRSWGQYLEDHRTTVQTRNSVSLALSGADFERAFRALIDNARDFSPHLFIRAWLNPTSEEDVRYVDPEPQATAGPAGSPGPTPEGPTPGAGAGPPG